MTSPATISGRKVTKAEAEKQLAEYRAEQERREVEAKEVRGIKAWDNAMQRIFKGICSRPLRHSFLKAAQKRLERTGTFELPARQDPNNPKGGIHTRADNPRKRRGPGGGGKRKEGPRR